MRVSTSQDFVAATLALHVMIGERFGTEELDGLTFGALPVRDVDTGETVANGLFAYPAGCVEDLLISVYGLDHLAGEED